MKFGLPLTKNVLTPLAESALIPLALTAATSWADAGIHKEILGPGSTTLAISNKEMRDIMTIVKSFKDCGLLIKVITQRIENETKEQRGWIP